MLKKVQEIFNKTVYTRAEALPQIHLFSDKDFEGISKSPYTVKSSLGHDLKGYFYYYDNPKEGRLVVFDHGMFCGHKNYFREIETLLSHGYLVFAYDHTGCMESGGDSTGGFSQSLRDLNDVITALKTIEALNGYEIYVVGHSWGGFATLNIPKFHPDIKKIVPISGFISPKEIIYQHLSGIVRIFAKKIYNIEREKSPDYMEISALDTLANCDTEALIIHSPNDHMVKYKRHFLRLKKAFSGKGNIEFLTVEGADHNPTYTLSAIQEKKLFYKKLKAGAKTGQFNTQDGCLEFKNSLNWWKITEQNSEVWNKIFEFLDK
ncbi:MAG: alpha/beta fold hydrolase [Clostridia bacterium]|nr:alpha/beta fold hydrolase [Clostridia bacterium]